MSSILNDSLLLSIECPSCLEYMTTNIFSCRSGHSLCSNCRKRISKCPICSVQLTYCRNYKLEEIAEKLKYPCPFSDSGCNEFHAFRVISDHVDECGYRDYKCMLDKDCKWLGQRTALPRHALMEHDSQSWMQEESLDRWKSTDSVEDVQLITAFEEVFYMYRKLARYTPFDIIYWYVKYIGNASDINQYAYQVQIYSEEYTNRKIIFEEQCHCDTKDDSEIFESGHCIAIPMHIFKTYRDNKNSVWFKVKMIKT